MLFDIFLFTLATILGCLIIGYLTGEFENDETPNFL